MTSDNWFGYVYEHVVVAEQTLGRSLVGTEVVHHLDGDRANNQVTNLLVLERGQHAKLHAWLDKGAPYSKELGAHGVNSEKAKVKEHPTCEVCGRTRDKRTTKYCSRTCRSAAETSATKPSKQELRALLKTTSWEALGRKYGVSGNAVRKWAKQYGLAKPTLSQAAGTPAEGAETSGEVQPS